MSWILYVHVLINLAATVVAVMLAGISWRRQSVPASRAFAWMSLSGAIWALTEAFETLSHTIELQVFWAKVGYFGKESLPVSFLLFALEYGYSQRRPGRGWRMLLWLFPAATMLIILTNDIHGLFWPGVYAAEGYSDLVFVFEHGIWFWLTLAYNYTLLLAGSLLLGRAALRSMQIYRRQGILILVGVGIPLVANFWYVLGMSPLPGLDVTPVAFAFSGLAYAWSMYRYRLLDLVPVARDLLIETLDEGVLVLDRQGRVVDLNPAAGRLTGLDERALGQPVWQVFPPWANLSAGSEDEDFVRSEALLEGYSQCYIEAEIKKLHSNQGKHIGRLVVLRDISERKRIEKMRDDLINTLVHDLRNPLGSVLLVLNSMESRSEAAGPDMLMIARHSAENMLGLVNEILDVSRLQAGQMPVQSQALDICMMVDNVLRLELPLAKERNMQLTTSIAGDLPFALGDYELVGRILQNLVGNAIKYTPTGGKVDVHAHEDRTAGMLEIRVTDCGPGIDPQLLPALFDLFTTGQGRGIGSGIGLFFCKLAVEAQGGRIWAENVVGGGAVLSFTLPIAR